MIAVISWCVPSLIEKCENNYCCHREFSKITTIQWHMPFQLCIRVNWYPLNLQRDAIIDNSAVPHGLHAHALHSATLLSLLYISIAIFLVNSTNKSQSWKLQQQQLQQRHGKIERKTK